MDKQEIIRKVDYRRASALARRVAVDLGAAGRSRMDEPDDQALFDICEEIDELIWESDLTDIEKTRLFLDVYADIPAYSLLFQFGVHRWRDLDPDSRALFWSQIKEWLSGDDDMLADPISYDIWSRYFEYSDEVEAAWQALVTDDASDRLIERVLEISGPVPYPLKSALYLKLLPDRRWHHFIYQSLLGSAFDYYGSIDKADVRNVLAQLDLKLNSEAERGALRRLRAQVSG
jgi:hypothetical protein